MLDNSEENYFLNNGDPLEIYSRQSNIEAVQALLKGDHQNFENIILKLYPNRLEHTNNVKVYTTHDMPINIKYDFEIMLNERVAEALVNSERDGRFLQKPEQIALHSFIKNLYFKQMKKLPDCVIKAFTYIASKISHYDDLYLLIKSIKTLNSNGIFNEIQPHMIALIKRNEPQPDWKLAQVLTTANEQQTLIIKLIVSSFLKRYTLDFSNTFSKIDEEIRTALQNNSYKNLLRYVLTESPALLSQLTGAVIKNQFECNFKENNYCINANNIHPALLDWQSIAEIMKNISFKQMFRIITNTPAIAQNGQLLLRYNLKLLNLIECQSKYYKNKSLDAELSTKFINFLKQLQDHVDLPFITVQDNCTDDKIFNVKYICKVFQLLERTVDKQGLIMGRVAFHLSQTFLIHWIKLFSKWQSHNQLKNQPFIVKAVQSLLSIFYESNRVESAEFPDLLNIESEFSKSLIQLINSFEEFQFSTSGWKGIKSILLKWGQSLINEHQQCKSILTKFFVQYFTPTFKITVQHRQDLFETPSISKIFKKMMSNQLISVLRMRVEQLLKQNITNKNHPSVKKYDQLILKIGIIISTKIPFDTLNQISKILYQLYCNFAHIWPLMYSFRLWILQIYRESHQVHLQTQIGGLIINFNELENAFEGQINQQNQIQNFSAHTISKFVQFQDMSHKLINCMQLKRHKQVYSQQLFQQYFRLVLLLEQKYKKWNQIWTKGSKPIKEWIQWGTNIGATFEKIREQFKLIIRYYLCNASKFLHIKQEEHIMNCIAKLFNKIIDEKGNDLKTWKLLNDLAAFNKIQAKSTLNSTQILGPLGKYTSKLNISLKLDDFIPFNFLSTLYSSIRHSYQDIFMLAFNIIEENQNDDNQQIWQTLQKIMFPSVNISGPCIFNGQNVDKTKEDMPLGIYFEQFQKLTQKLFEGKDGTKVYRSILLKLQNRKIISKFLQILKLKTVKITQKARNHPNEHRYRSRPQSLEDVTRALMQMGIPRQQVDIALQNIEYPDQNLAMQWIDNNQDRLEEILFQRTMQKSKNQRLSNQRSEGKVQTNGAIISALSYDRFVQKQKMIKLIRHWIQGIYRELFKYQQIQIAQQLKSILFLLMENLRPESSKFKQYENLNLKVYKELDQIQKSQNISRTIQLLMSILEGTFEKVQNSKKDFYSKAINLKVISYLPKLTDKQDRIRIFSLINTTLPVFSHTDNINAELENYLAYLLDLILEYRYPHRYLSQIMFKIAKSKNINLIKRVTRNLSLFLRQNLIQQNIVPLINLIFDADSQLNLINAQLDLKTYLLERYKFRIADFDPLKEHVLQIDIKQFSNSFPKYDKGSAIYEISKKLLTKKKNKNRYFYYDCRKPQNAFDYSSVGERSFLKYVIQDNQRYILSSMISHLFKCSEDKQEELLAQIHKLLLNYRILLPFVVSQTFEGVTLVDWLISSPNHSRRKFKLLVFLTLNSNNFAKLNEGLYSFYSIGDFVCAKIIQHLIKTNYNTGDIWTIFTALYLLQVRKFSQLASSPLSQDQNTTLDQVYESILSKVNSTQFIPLSQYLYVQYKRVLLDNLRRKYKFIGAINQSSFDRQFLNISAFYNNLPIKKIQQKESEARDQISQVEPIGELFPNQQEQLEEQMIFGGGNARMRLINNRNQPQLRVAPIQEILAPVIRKQNKEASEQQEQAILEPFISLKKIFVFDIIQKFNQYFGFEEESISPQFTQVFVPTNVVTLPNLKASFTVKIEDNSLDIEIKVNKLTRFEKRMIEILSVLDPALVWDKKNASNGRDRQPSDLLNRRLFEGLGHLNNDNRQQIIAHLERLISHRARQANQQIAQPNRVINTTDIFQNIQEFTQPILPIIQQPVAQIPVVPVQPPAQQDIIQEKVPEQVKKDEVHLPQVMEIQNQNKHEQVKIEENQEHKVVEVVPPVGENQLPLDLLLPVVHQQPLDIEQHRPVVAQQPINQIQQPIPAPLIIPEIIPQQPQIDRQILRIFGLPQTFLEDAGIDSQLFDQLPEDLQQEQLMQFMNQQRINTNQNRPNNGNNQNQQLDQQSQNLAFIDSLDPQTRAQVLIEATPDFLQALPVTIREQAQRYRHQRINSMIEQEQIQEQAIKVQKAKIPIVYPKLNKQQFTKINDKAAQFLFEGMFYIEPYFNLSAIKVLLQNKQTQDKTVSSIITILKYFDENKEKVNYYRKDTEFPNISFQNKQKWNLQNAINIRTYLLHIIYQHLKNPLYKDQQFLTQQISLQCYSQQLLSRVSIEDSYYPEIKLLAFALNYYPDLATELIKKVKDLPQELLQKIVQLIRSQGLPKQFYENMHNFSQNQKLKHIFARQFEMRPPKTQILGALLKYKFSHLQCLKKIHQQTLQYYSSNSIQFLNQIFCLYSLQNISEIQPLLLKHKQIHFQVIKYLYQHGRQLEKEPIGLILKKPHLLDFETKKFIFRNHPRIRKQARHRIQIEVDRNHLFQGSFNQLMQRTARELEGRIQVSFINEPGYDAGGLKRQWFLVVSRQIFNQHYALFQKSSSGSTYQPNPKSYINPDHLNYFKFIGRFIGKALVQRQLIDAYFTRAFYKMILGQQLQFKDLQQQDYQFFKSMQWLKNNKIDEDIFTFSYIYDNFGNRIEKELVPGGKTITVNEQNKKEYIQKYCLAKMRDDFSSQINKFLEGFYQIVPIDCISYFEAKELQLLISGVPEVDLQDLKKNTDYSGYNPTDQIIIWFWEVVSEYSQQDLAKLVQFITGTSKIPVEGFSQIVGMNGIQRISIHRDPCENQLPKSHTCFNQLDLPNYATKQILKTKLGICLAWGSEGFGFM